jgi:fluoride exporter
VTGALTWIGVGLLGALGAWARFAASEWLAAVVPGAFPLGTFAVNVTGGAALGLLTGLDVGADAALLLGTGFLGAYTTFSTWMVEATRLRDHRRADLMWLHLLGSIASCLAAAGLFWALGAALT